MRIVIHVRNYSDLHLTHMRFLLAFLSVPALLGAAVSAGAQLPPTTANFHGKAVIEVPYRIVHGLVTIPVSINGSPPLQLILDSGSPVIVLTDTAAPRKYGLNIVGEAGVGGAGDGEQRRVPLARGITARVGDLEVRNVTGIVTGLQSVISGTDGVIGGAFFSNAVVEFDFDARVIRFHHPTSGTVVMRGDTVPLRVEPSLHPYVRGTVVVNGTTMPLDLHFDTGAQQPLAVARETMTRHNATPTHAIPTIVGFGSRGAARGDWIRASELQIGSAKLDRVPASVMDNEPGGEGRIGLPVIERFHTWVDFPGKRIVLGPRANFAEPFPSHTVGLVLRPGRDSSIRVVADVPRGTPAHDAGLQVGDTLVSVNGRSLASLDAGSMRMQAITAPVGVPVLLGVRRGGATIELRVVPRVLLP